MTTINAPDLEEHVSSHAFDATIERLVRAIQAHGMTVFAQLRLTGVFREIKPVCKRRQCAGAPGWRGMVQKRRKPVYRAAMGDVLAYLFAANPI